LQNPRSFPFIGGYQTFFSNLLSQQLGPAKQLAVPRLTRAKDALQRRSFH
jgi:hypothetical protein